MNVELGLPGADAMGRVFLTWTPVAGDGAARATRREPAPVTVTLRSAGTGGRPQVRDHPHASRHADAHAQPARQRSAGSLLRRRRVRASERRARRCGDRGARHRQPRRARHEAASPCASARTPRRSRPPSATASSPRFGTLNGGGAGRFRDFRDMHVLAATPKSTATSASCRGIAPTSSISNASCRRSTRAWRCPTGGSTSRRRTSSRASSWACRMPPARVQFTAGHPFGTWRTDGALGISRTPSFSPASAPAGSLNEAADDRARRRRAERLLRELRRAWRATRTAPRTLSFSLGFIRSIPTAARDPLFFLLHANVDRLWAKWQWMHRRTSPAEPRAFAPASPNRIGHRLADTMWPWNGVTGAPRPPTAPGGTLAPSPSTTAPGRDPRSARCSTTRRSAGGRAARVRLRRRAVRGVTAREDDRGWT